MLFYLCKGRFELVSFDASASDIMFSIGSFVRLTICPSIHPCVHPSVRSSLIKIVNTIL